MGIFLCRLSLMKANYVEITISHAFLQITDKAKLLAYSDISKTVESIIITASVMIMKQKRN